MVPVTVVVSFSAILWLSISAAVPLLPTDDTREILRRRPPVFPDAFQVSYNFSLPYEGKIQSDGLTYDVTVWRDAKKRRHRMDTYFGSNSLITTQDLDVEVVPQLDKLACMAYEPDGSSALLQAPVLPDVSQPHWQYRGLRSVRGEDADLWEFEQRHGEKLTVFKFYVTMDGAPRRLYMHGNDIFSGAHFDKYIADFTDYVPGIRDNGVFDRPAICKQPAQGKSTVRPFLARMAALLPSPVNYGGDEEYDGFSAMHGRRHASQQEYDARRQVFHSNKAAVTAAAAQGVGYTMALNRFADWTQEEFEAIMLPRHGRGQGLRAAKGHSAELPYERKAATTILNGGSIGFPVVRANGQAKCLGCQVPKGRVPRAVDWRHTGADLSIKDQAVCGSCWAFSTTGTLQGAYFIATGRNASFSEQQLMDCSWGHGLNHACDGGDQDDAIQYVVEAGGIAPEATYTYMGQDGFCRDKNVTGDQLVKFKGFAYVPEYDDEALMEAVYSRGPIAVSLDASQPGFRFYSSGVYSSPTCMYKPEDLDHAVIVSGYGTTSDGQDYWIVRNSWSDYWGNKGYIKIARHGPGQACGITSGALYAVAEAT